MHMVGVGQRIGDYSYRMVVTQPRLLHGVVHISVEALWCCITCMVVGIDALASR